MNSKNCLFQDLSLARKLMKYPKQYLQYKIYHTLTENGRAVLENSSSNFETCFTIIGSFDQAFNLICKGCKNLVLCDINPLTYYHVKLCIGAVLALSKEEYISFRLNGNSPFSLSSFGKMKPFLEPEVFFFWKLLFQIYGQKEVFNRIYENAEQYYQSEYLSAIFNFNLYLETNHFQKLKESLKNTELEFYFCDFLKLPDSVWKRHYDEVYLSNIAVSPNKLDIPNYVNYLNHQVKPTINPNGELVSTYLSNHQYYMLSKEERKLLIDNTYQEQELECKTIWGSRYKEHIYTYQKRK